MKLNEYIVPIGTFTWCAESQYYKYFTPDGAFQIIEKQQMCFDFFSFLFIEITI